MFVFKKILTRKDREARHFQDGDIADIHKMAMFVEESQTATQLLDAFAKFLKAQGFYEESIYRAMFESGQGYLEAFDLLDNEEPSEDEDGFH